MSLLAVLNPVIEDVSEHIPQEVSMGNCPEKCSAKQALTIARQNSPIPLKQMLLTYKCMAISYMLTCIYQNELLVLQSKGVPYQPIY